MFWVFFKEVLQHDVQGLFWEGIVFPTSQWCCSTPANVSVGNMIAAAAETRYFEECGAVRNERLLLELCFVSGASKASNSLPNLGVLYKLLQIRKF